MQQAGHIFSLDTLAVPVTLSDQHMPLLQELMHGDLTPVIESLAITDFDMNSWSSTWSPTAEESFASMMQSGSSTDAELQALMEDMDQLEEYHTNNNPTSPMLTSSSPGASASSQLSSPEVLSADSHMVPMISSEHQSYHCSWNLHGSSARCDHVAPDRPAFLRHLGEMHQASGNPGTMITCQLLDSKMGLACETQIKRGSFARHVDTHYPLRYHCQYCPAGKSFSRQDSWKKHIKDKHVQAPPAS